MGEGEGKERLGELEELVLLAALRIGDRAYGSAIVEELERTARRRVARASVYVLLRRMEKSGLIRTWREDAAEARGRPRRFVEVTPDGIALLERSRRARLRMWKGIEARLEGR